MLAFITSCIHLPRSFHALSYKNQTVFIDKNHFYRVGPLSSEWHRSKLKSPGIIFIHQSGARLATEAFCGAAYEDLPLEMLTKHLLVGLQDVKTVKQEKWKLSDREALYTKSLASLDGVEVLLNILVIKKDKCHFDFLATSSLSAKEVVTCDFEQFVKGFDY